MWHQLSRRLSTGILAVLLALGMSWSTLDAGVLPPQTMLYADGFQPACCNDCGAAGDSGMGACRLVCLAGSQAVLPDETVTPASGSGNIGAGARFLVSARTVHPDPDPPRRLLLD